MTVPPAGTVVALEDATTAFEEVIKLNPKVLEARIQLSQLHLLRSNPQLALQYAEEAANLATDNAPAHLVLARALTANGDAKRAEAVLKVLIADAPKAGAVHAALGEVMLLRGDTAAAKKAFDQALAFDPSSLDALRGL